MPREIPDLTDTERQHIRNVLGFWAEVHPRRDKPLIQLADGSELTPRDIGRAAAEPGSPRGRLIYRIFAVALLEDEVERPESLDEILDDYERDASAWSRGEGLE